MNTSLFDNACDLQIEEHGADTVDRLPQMPEYVRFLTRQGALFYIDNAHVEVKTIVVDNLVFPLVISSSGQSNADVCSPFSHYAAYTLEELIKRNKRMPPGLLRMAARAFGSLLKACHIDRVVYVNNWLWATNPHQPLSSRQICALTTYLTRHYPGHAIVFRSVNPYLHKGHFEALREVGYLMVKSRTVYVLDPSKEGTLDHDNVRRDLRLLKKTAHHIVEPAELTDSAFLRITELYRSLYLDKHSLLNPQLNCHFFSMTFRKGALTYKILEKRGRINGFVNYYIRDNILTGAFLGYDRTLPQAAGLYRMTIALLISEAKSKGLLLNLSAGSGGYKVLRGAFPVPEYDAVYDRHLPAKRRLAWRLVWIEGTCGRIGNLVR